MRSARCAALVAVFLLGVVACDRPSAGCTGDYCGTVIFAAAREPDILLPPVTQQTLSRDIVDQIFLKLADIGPSMNTLGEADFEPRLAQRWEWDDPLTLVFHLDPRARWQDGRPVTAADVAFTFDAYTDPAVNSPAGTNLRRIRAVTARDSLTAVFRFRERYAEMFYDAVYHTWVLPAHILHIVPRDRWATAEFGRRPLGNGPYRFVEWRAGERIELAADSTFFLGRPHIRRLIWRVTPDMPAAVGQLLAGEVDALEFLLTPDVLRQVRAAPHLTTHPYGGSIYTYLAFNFRANGDTTRPHPVFGDRDVRRALFLATDRERLRQSVFGDVAKLPPGPLSVMWRQLWEVDARPLPYDSARAARLLDQRGWRDSDGDGIRDKDGVKMSFRLAAPTTSAARRQYAQLLQAQYRSLGVAVEIEEFEASVLEERARRGQFDAALASWQTDPAPMSSIAQTWTSGGIGGSNWGRYVNPEVERLLERAAAAPAAERRRISEAVLRLLNDDAAGIWLYSIQTIAAVHARIADVRLRADTWWTYVRDWRIPPERLIDRDRVVR